MARLRIIDPQGLYHVMSRGNYRRTIFPDEDHFLRWAFVLDRVVGRRRWIVLDYCAMPNHHHLVVQLTDGGLSEGMRELNGCYSRWSNAIHGLTGTGHLVLNRFRHKQVDSDAYLMQLARYLPLNPVKPDLVEHPVEWAWSGYRACAGLAHPLPFHRPEALLKYFDDSPARARRLYRQHVLEGPDPDGLDLWSDHVGKQRD